MNEQRPRRFCTRFRPFDIAAIATALDVSQRAESARSWLIQGPCEIGLNGANGLIDSRTVRLSFPQTSSRCVSELGTFQDWQNASKQLIESANSVGSNHLVMRRGRSDREFASKLQIVNEEIVESVGWLELIDKVLDQPDATVRTLLGEGRELRAIFAKAKMTTNERLERQESQRRRK